MSESEYIKPDVIVIGGGNAGRTTARALTEKGVSVLLTGEYARTATEVVDEILDNPATPCRFLNAMGNDYNHLDFNHTANKLCFQYTHLTDEKTTT